MEAIETLRALDPADVLRTFTSQNARPSSRQHAAARRTTVVRSVLTRNTYGSSLVRLGDTQVLSAVTLSVGVPGPATPYHGDVSVSLKVSPLCSRGYNISGRVIEGGGGGTAGNRLDPASIESHLQRIVRLSGMVDLAELGIVGGKAAWRLKVGCVVLNDAGNLFDACLLGCVSALADTRLPRTKVDSTSSTNEGMVRIVAGGDPNNGGSNGTRLNLDRGKIPVSLAVGMFDNKLLVDPDEEEEGVICGSVSVVVNAAGGVVSVDKRGRKMISAKQLAACVHMAHGRAKELKDVFVPEAVEGNVGRIDNALHPL